ncbi:MAG TPA: hypothetical protein VKD66_21885 [Streptosporangiaceae bacterium]|nr:hypothetical protein [Streptosporangiaceae bacterium]
MSAAGGGDGDDIRLEQLRRLYPRWSIWRGRVTGDYWAMPPRGHATQYELITAPNAEELAQRLAEAEERHNRLGGAPAAGGPVRGRSLDKPPALSGGFDEQARGRVWRARRGRRRRSG